MKSALLIFLASLFALSCSTQNTPEQGQGPLTKGFIPDERAPHSEEDLRELLVTLPVWDISPERIIPWIQDHGEATEKTLLVNGDGSQDTLRLRKLSLPNTYELRIGTEEWADSGISYYTLKRQPNAYPKGWQVLNRR